MEAGAFGFRQERLRFALEIAEYLVRPFDVEIGGDHIFHRAIIGGQLRHECTGRAKCRPDFGNDEPWDIHPPRDKYRVTPCPATASTNHQIAWSVALVARDVE